MPAHAQTASPPPDVDPRSLAVSTRALRKTYRTRHGRHVAVQGLDLDVPIGGVHGFLGPNGSGKTTSIRMLLGLVRADSGTMSIFGQEVPQALPDVVGRVGAIVEQPKFFPTFTARKNLDLLAAAIGTPAVEVGKVLEAVGLDDRAKDRYKTYSLGMKQRLAIAATLLKDPDLLIFDEPTNGLDPAGIREIRTTMRGLADQGKTVLVSSHILAEVEQVADTVSIIGHGRLLASGRVEDIIAGTSTTVRVGIADPAAARTVLERAGLTVRTDHDALMVDGVDDPADITRRLAHDGLFVRELVSVKAGLEAVFLQLTAGEGPGTQAPPGPDGRPTRRSRRGGDR
ncbi:ABC-type multidrug transport system, ATPase component [Sanguibacter keddieii DSM 10542]|uniref:ABC-type multidrug transport system, ATPase component n=1 Tax=Sanguibacter keddieii (strain ATCC 51767 / DSM 10542 / NCFB 3025 / ST-74) TaxID=446469 RepID=D1BJH4_SANKS|nr:ATP-binding cassette domain-containing protein [Sanguibacter keddieii]ACZ20230.1 ABC-type multidrug transport system, ATPase component [Sanguibacter keddieii DSM 10542]